MRHIVFVLIVGCALPMIGQAQQHAAMAIPAMSGAHFAATTAPMAVGRVAPIHPVISARPVARNGPAGTRLGAASKTVHPAGWNHTTRHAAVSTDPVFPNGGLTTDGYGVPGLGFDYPHYFATHPNAARFQHGSGFVIPFFSGGFYLPVPMYADESSSAQQAEETAAAEQPEPAEEPAAREQNPSTRRRVLAEAAPAQQSEYVFVRRDGTLIFAVGYSWINDRLQYITDEGLRRTAPLNTLDLDATQQFNEQRGVPIQLPA